MLFLVFSNIDIEFIVLEKHISGSYTTVEILPTISRIVYW